MINIAANGEPRITELKVIEDSITARLADRRMVSVPLAWSWRLSDATPEQRNNFEIMGNGQGVHWPDIDEDISAVGMLCGTPAQMKKNSETDELRPEYDLKELLKNAVRGKYAERYRTGTNLVLLDPDIAKAFPTPEAVNEALRLVLRLAAIPATQKPGAAKSDS